MNINQFRFLSDSNKFHKLFFIYDAYFFAKVQYLMEIAKNYEKKCYLFRESGGRESDQILRPPFYN
jgi:hypothetical protein